MGTNFYWYGPCHECGTFHRIHIGKASAGWYFNLHVIPGIIENLDDWKERFVTDDSLIVDEYNSRLLTPDEMLEIIRIRKGSSDDLDKIKAKASQEDDIEVDAEYCLYRFVAGKDGCLGHGSGPWSYITGEFS